MENAAKMHTSNHFTTYYCIVVLLMIWLCIILKTLVYLCILFTRTLLTPLVAQTCHSTRTHSDRNMLEQYINVYMVMFWQQRAKWQCLYRSIWMVVARCRPRTMRTSPYCSIAIDIKGDLMFAPTQQKWFYSLGTLAWLQHHWSRSHGIRVCEPREYISISSIIFQMQLPFVRISSKCRKREVLPEKIYEWTWSNRYFVRKYMALYACVHDDVIKRKHFPRY